MGQPPLDLYWRAWRKFVRRRRMKREALAPLPPAAPEALVAPPPAGPPPAPKVEGRRVRFDGALGVEARPASRGHFVGARRALVSPACASSGAPRTRAPRGGERRLRNATLRCADGGAAVRLWSLLAPPTRALVVEFHAQQGPRYAAPVVAVDA